MSFKNIWFCIQWICCIPLLVGIFNCCRSCCRACVRRCKNCIGPLIAANRIKIQVIDPSGNMQHPPEIPTIPLESISVNMNPVNEPTLPRPTSARKEDIDQSRYENITIYPIHDYDLKDDNELHDIIEEQQHEVEEENSLPNTMNQTARDDDFDSHENSLKAKKMNDPDSTNKNSFDSPDLREVDPALIVRPTSPTPPDTPPDTPLDNRASTNIPRQRTPILFRGLKERESPRRSPKVSEFGSRLSPDDALAIHERRKIRGPLPRYTEPAHEV